MTSTPAPPSSAASGRLHALDSLRALAALGVIAWHYVNHFGAAPAADLLQPFYARGLLLVDFFFVLSGFVLARAYWSPKRCHALVRNLRERIARIYPLHAAMLCLVAAMQWWLVHRLENPPFIYTFNDKYDFVLHALLLNRTGLERGWAYNAPSWSISTEFVVNVVFFVLIALPRHWARIGLAAVFAISTAVLVQHGLLSNETAWGGIANDVFRTAFGFVAGVALFGLHTHCTTRGWRLSAWAADALAMAATGLFLYYCAAGPYTPQRDMAVVLLLFPLLILGTVQGRWLQAALRLRPLVWLGTISYSIYLVHFPLQLGVHLVGVAMGWQMAYASPIFLAVFYLGTIGFAALTYNTVEIPGKKAIGQFWKKELQK